VTEALTDHLGRDAGLQGGRGVRVAYVVEPDLGEAGRLAVPVEELSDRVRMQGATIGPHEKEWGRRAEEPTFLAPHSQIAIEGSASVRIEGNRRSPLLVLGSE